MQQVVTNQLFEQPCASRFAPALWLALQTKQTSVKPFSCKALGSIRFYLIDTVN